MLFRSKAIAFFVLLSVQLLAQPDLNLFDTTKLTNVGLNLALFEDSSAALRIDEIMDQDSKGSFAPSKFQIPNYNLTPSTVWCRLRVRNLSRSNDWYLEATNGNISHIILYDVKGGKVISSAKGGFSVWAGTRAFFSNRPVFHLELPKDSLCTFYIALSDLLPLQANLTVGNIKGFIGQNHKLDFFNGAFYGLLFMLAIYNLFIFFSVRDRVFIYYILYIFGNGLFISFANGYASHFPFFITRIMVEHPNWVPFVLGMSACIFMINFLAVKKNYPFGYKVCLVMMVVFTSIVPLDWLGFTRSGIMIVQLMGLVLSVFSVIIGIVVLRKGYRPAKFYLLAFSFYLVGLFMYIAADAQLIPFNAYTHNALQIGTAFEAILLSLAVSDKISNFKKDKEKAQEEALAIAMENERLVREQNMELERKVKERTIELQQQKELVEEKNKDILDSIRYAKRIQQSLLPSQRYIERALNVLKSSGVKE